MDAPLAVFANDMNTGRRIEVGTENEYVSVAMLIDEVRSRTDGKLLVRIPALLPIGLGDLNGVNHHIAGYHGPFIAPVWPPEWARCSAVLPPRPDDSSRRPIRDGKRGR